MHTLEVDFNIRITSHVTTFATFSWDWCKEEFIVSLTILLARSRRNARFGLIPSCAQHGAHVGGVVVCLTLLLDYG